MGITYDDALDRLARHELAMAPGTLRRILGHDARMAALNRATEGRPSGADTLGRAFDRYRTLLAAHAAFATAGVLDPISADATKDGVVALARDAVLWGRSVWNRLRDARDPLDGTDGIDDGIDLPFADRFLANRLLSVADPRGYALRLRANPAHREAAELVAAWWAERLLDLALAPDRRVPLRPGQAEAFRVALADAVTLTRAHAVGMDYEPGLHLRIAMAEAGLPAHALDGWRMTLTEIHAETCAVTARIGAEGEPRPVPPARVPVRSAA